MYEDHAARAEFFYTRGVEKNTSKLILVIAKIKNSQMAKFGKWLLH
jgi:hypothetical protein